MDQIFEVKSYDKTCFYDLYNYILWEWISKKCFLSRCMRNLHTKYLHKLNKMYQKNIYEIIIINIYYFIKCTSNMFKNYRY